MWQLSSIQLLYSERMSFIIPTYIFQDPSSIICVRHLRPIHRSLSLNAFTTLVHGMICTQMDSFGMLFTLVSLPPKLLSPNNKLYSQYFYPSYRLYSVVIFQALFWTDFIGALFNMYISRSFPLYV